jgi:hypothetical protein
MELFRRNGNFFRFVWIKVDVIRAYLSYNIVAIKTIGQFYAHEVMVSIVSVEKFLTVLADKLK